MRTPIILCDCEGMEREKWLECRMHGPKGDIPYTVGGSDIAVIFGLSPWITPLELWMVKKGRLKTPPKANTMQLEMGHMLEPIAAHFFAVKTGYELIKDTNLYQHPDHPYALANLDYRYRRPADNETGTMDCKSTTYHKADAWSDGALPIYYEMQVRYYMDFHDDRHGAISCIWGNNPENDMAIPEIVKDSAKIDMIFEKLEEWNWSLENEKPPKMDGVDPTLAMKSLAKIYGASKKGLPTIEFSSKYERDLRSIHALQEKISERREEIRKYEKEVEARSVRIAEIMKEHEHGVLETTNDKLLIDFVTKTSMRVSTDKLKKEYPKVYEDTRLPSTSRKIKVTVEAA